MDLIDARDSIQTRRDLGRFVSLLREDLLHNEDAWENSTLDRYLEALAAWIADMDGYFRNQGISEPERPDWHLVGQMLFAASIYE
ncbi:MAG TPA: hypothetical protein VFZ30_10275 [Acidimicrobiales bacterium]